MGTHLLANSLKPASTSPAGRCGQGYMVFHSRLPENVACAFNPSGKSGVYGGYQDWIDRPGRFRSPGDGQVDFKSVFSKLAQYNYAGWAVLEWECCIKHPEQGAKEGAPFIKNHMIKVTDKAFDEFASAGTDAKLNRKILGI